MERPATLFVEDGRSVFRAMQGERDRLPAVGPTARKLGVRPGEPPCVGGLVRPLSGGMSVALDNPRELPEHRRPPSLDGTGRDPVFAAVLQLSRLLYARQDRPPELHACVEPAEACAPEVFQANLGATRSRWSMLAP